MALSARLLRPRASGGGFDPRSIANCALWLDASVDSSLTFNGNTVSEWRDLSGNGRHFSQGTAAEQPDGVSRTENGRRALEFSGGQLSGKQLVGNAASLSITRNVGGITLFCVVRLDTANEGYFRGFIHFSRNGNAGNSRATIQAGTNNYLVGGRRTDSDSFQSVDSGANSTNTNLIIHSGVMDYANSDAFVYVDGQLKGTSLSFQTDGLTPDNDSDVATIGSVNGVNYHDGTIGEILVYRRALTTGERQAVERYLGAKWGVSVA